MAGKQVKSKLGALPRVAIEGIRPQINAGRYPIKRVLGESVEVEADIYKDGHDLLAARVCFRGPGDRAWRHVPMRYDFDADCWSASFTPDRLGFWLYTVEAWKDELGTWRSELDKFLRAGQDVESELLEGAVLLRAASLRLRGAQGKRLAAWASVLEDTEAPFGERVAVALSADLRGHTQGLVDPAAIARFERELTVKVDRERARFAAWYELFPRSQGPMRGRHGTFADAERRLPHLASLGFDVVYLPPIHPIGHTHRKGKNNSLVAGPQDPGSPWAIGNADGGHTAVEPKLGTVADFERFARSAAALGMEVALDYALQCSPDHPWVQQHREWFFVRPDGTIRYAENPPKKYQDIYPLNFWCEDHHELWHACRDVLLFWIARGVKTFRVDNPHTKPLAFWGWVIPEVQREHPEVVFLSEAFTRPKRMKGLAKLGFTQSYTYFTWRNSAQELRDYLTELTQTETAEYMRGNFFANTPDILPEYLQTGGRPAFRIRLLLAATLLPAYGIYSGYELCESAPLRPGSEDYLDSEKYELRHRDYDAPGNINEDIRTINRIRRENPALQLYRNLSFHTSENESILFYRKSAPGNELLIAVNLNPRAAEATMVHVPLQELGIGADEPYEVEDLLSGARYTWRGARSYVRLDPAENVGHVLRVKR
jgi:starch synthase (maltosyl-transferring)